MDVAQTPATLPGTPTGSSFRFMSRIMAVFALLFSGFAALDGYQAGAAGGHLRSPLLQFAFATPGGVLLLIVIGTISFSPSFLIMRRIALARYLARTVDVTDVPPAAWPRRPPGWTQRFSTERWLGRGRRTQAINLVILIFDLLATLLLAGAFIAPFVYIHTPECTTNSCPPDHSPSVILLASLVVALSLMHWAQYQRVRYIEAECGIWLRDARGGGESAPQYYLRRPGVTSEQASAALARFRPSRELPVAQTYALIVLSFAWLVALYYGERVLAAWLPTQWVPG